MEVLQEYSHPGLTLMPSVYCFADMCVPHVFLRFRAVHEEAVKLDQDFGATFSGVLTDEAGRLRALWGSYAEQVEKEEREWCAGLPTDVFAPWVVTLLHLDFNEPLPPPPVR